MLKTFAGPVLNYKTLLRSIHPGNDGCGADRDNHCVFLHKLVASSDCLHRSLNEKD